MTVNTPTAAASYTGNGTTTAFPIPFYFLVDGDLKVSRKVASTGATSVLALNSDYTLAGAGNGLGGTLTMNTAPAANDQLYIERNVSAIQQTAYPENGRFPSTSHEKALDRLTMLAQQQITLNGRSLIRDAFGTTYDLGTCTLVNAGPAANDSDVPTLLQVRGAIVAGALPAIGTDSGAAIVGYKAAGAGAQSRTVAERLADEETVFNYMTPAQIADVKAGTALLDVTSAIQAAVSANKYLYFPAGVYLISAPITLQDGSTLRGAGYTSTKIVRAGANLSAFVVRNNCEIGGFYFDRKGTTIATQGAWISSNGFSSLRLAGIYVAYGYNGVTVSNLAGAFFDSLYINNCVLNALLVDGGTNDILLTNFIFGFNGNGIFLNNKCEALICVNGDVLGSTNCGIVMQAASNTNGARPQYNKFTNVYFDTSGSHCASLANSYGNTFSNCWFSTSSANGVVLGTNASNTRLTGCEVFNNRQAGIAISDATAQHTRIADSTITNNNMGGVGANGITVFANVNYVSIQGCTIGNIFSGFPALQAYGVFIAAGTSDHIVMANNVFTGNVTGSVGDGSTGANKNIHHNDGYTTRTFGTVAIAAGASSITFAHNLPSAPASGAVHVTPGGDPQQRWWVSSITATQITISTAATVASTAFFYWTAWVNNA